MTTKYLFSNPSYITIKDPYNEKRPISSRDQGKQFSTSPTFKGRIGKNVYFSPFRYSSSPYIDRFRLERLYRKKRMEKMKTMKIQSDEVFRFSSPSKKPSGSGSSFGNFSSYEYKYPFKRKEGAKKKKDRELRRNFVTNPSKNGTFGFPGTTLQKDIYGGWTKANPPGKLTYRDFQRATSQKHRKKLSGKKPFLGISRTKPCFDSHDKVNASRILRTPNSLLRKRKEDPGERRRRMEERRKLNPRPFRSGGPPGSASESVLGTFVKCPKYESDGIYITDPKKKKKKFSEQGRGKVFMPVSFPKIGPTRSILIKGSNTL